MIVTKKQNEEKVIALNELGQIDFGENYVDEADQKINRIKAKKISPPQIKNLRKKIADLDKNFKTGKAEFWAELRKIIVNFGYI